MYLFHNKILFLVLNKLIYDEQISKSPITQWAQVAFFQSSIYLVMTRIELLFSFFSGWLSDEGVVRCIPRGRRSDPIRLPQPHRRCRRRASACSGGRCADTLHRIPCHLPRHPKRGHFNDFIMSQK